MRIRAVSVLLGVLALIVGVGVAASGHTGVEHWVTAASFEFTPAVITVNRGDHIRFSNSDHAPHTLSVCRSELCEQQTGYLLDSGPLTADQSRLLETKGLPRGEWTFECRFHTWMQGTLVVD